MSVTHIRSGAELFEYSGFYGRKRNSPAPSPIENLRDFTVNGVRLLLPAKEYPYVGELKHVPEILQRTKFEEPRTNPDNSVTFSFKKGNSFDSPKATVTYQPRTKSLAILQAGPNPDRNPDIKVTYAINRSPNKAGLTLEDNTLGAAIAKTVKQTRLKKLHAREIPIKLSP